MPDAVPQIKTRKPTGKPSWPSCLLSGVDHAGKSYAAAEASASDLIGRTFWIEYGESTADAYGAIPGARYEIVEHDGAYLSVLAAVRAASAQPRVDGKPNLIVFDSGSELWSTLSEEQAIIARARRKKTEAETVVITPDQWNLATSRWNKVLAVLRKHDGPTIITARLKEVMLMDAGGNPTKDKEWKPEIQNKTRYAMDLTIEMRAHRTYLLTGSRSVALPIPEERDGVDLPSENTFDRLWKRLGLDVEGATAHRQIVEGDAAAGVAELESAAAAVDGDVEDRGPAPKADAIEVMVKDIVGNAKDNPALALRALDLLMSSHGEDVLRNVGPCALKDGRQVSARVLIQVAREYVGSLPYKEPEAETRQPEPDARADEERAREVGARLIEQGEQANAQAPAPADAPQDAPTPGSETRAPARTVRDLWMDELVQVHVPAHGIELSAYIKPLLEHGSAKTLDEVEEKVLAPWLATRRRPTVSALRRKGMATAAERLDKANRNEPAPASLVFADDDTAAAPAEK